MKVNGASISLDFSRSFSGSRNFFGILLKNSAPLSFGLCLSKIETNREIGIRRQLDLSFIQYDDVSSYILWHSLNPAANLDHRSDLIIGRVSILPTLVKIDQ